MRMLMRVQMDTTAANQAIKAGQMMEVINGAAERLRPEAMYFSLHNGRRCAYFVVNIEEASQMPMMAEPLFQGINAEIDLFPAMTLDEVAAGIDRATTATG
jgi:hypothetical protein